MRPAWVRCLVGVCLFLGGIDRTARAGAQPDAYWPGRVWRVSTPEAQGMDSARLAALFDYVSRRRVQIHSLQVVRHGHVVLDAYFYPFSRDSLHDVASVTKSVTSGLVGIALDANLLGSADQTALRILSDRHAANLDARKQAITLEHLLMMASGLDCGYRRGEPELAAMLRTDRWVQYVLDLPMRDEPGTRFAYCSGNFHLLSAVLTRATGQSELAFARRRLFEPLGIRDVYWPADREGLTHGWGDLHLKPLDMARIGYLYLRRGRWRDARVISEQWAERSTRGQIGTGRGNDYGYGWWTVGAIPGLYEAVGRGGQRISVWPKKDLVVVFTGGEFEPGDLAPFLLGALKSDGALPENTAAYRLLQERAAAALVPPTPTRIQLWPATASRITGRVYRLGANSLGLRSFRLRFPRKGRGEITLSLPDRRIVVPVGFDGVYRTRPDGPARLPIGGRGVWLSADELNLDLNFIARINRYDVRLRFEADRVAMHIREATGLTDESIDGIASE